jgi:lipid II:glycine glycyltransferase (peptidoglycan interpeptide bridge formation enzyme)
MPLVSLAEWNLFTQKHPDCHILQTGEWGELKAAFGWRSFRIIKGEAGVQILVRSFPLGFKLAYLPKPISFDRSPLWDEIESLCKSQRSIFLKVEPDRWEKTPDFKTYRRDSPPPGFVSSSHPIQPPRTILVSLCGTEAEILARMKQKCRYNIRLAEKKGVTIRSWNDIKGFHAMMSITGRRDGFGFHSFEYYKRAHELFRPSGMAELLVAEFEGKPLAALMAFVHGKRAWYLYGASTDEERNRMPTYLLQWEAMRWAKSKGAEEYDLWGVPDEDEATLEAQFESRGDGLWGVYRFKRGFGGEVLRAAPAMDKIYSSWLYRLYKWRMTGRDVG